MNGRSQRQSQAFADAANDKAPTADLTPREDRGNDFPFFYADCCLGFFPADPVDLYDFAKGQLMAMAIFVPAAIALFIFFCA